MNVLSGYLKLFMDSIGVQVGTLVSSGFRLQRKTRTFKQGG
jgi:hypothetical protein